MANHIPSQCFFCALVAISLPLVSSNRLSPANPNVLFIMADDFRVEISHWSQQDQASGWHPWAPAQAALNTPNLDRLSQSAFNVRGTFTVYPLCSPSRAAMLVSRSPETTHIYEVTPELGGSYFRTIGGNFTTLPQYFRQHGYRTVSRGKIFHGRKEQDNDASWDDVKAMDAFAKSNSWSLKPPPYIFYPGDDPYNHYPDVGVISDDNESLMEDFLLGRNARKKLQELVLTPGPWFFAVGFHHPHSAHFVPGRYVGPTAFDGFSEKSAAWWKQTVSSCEKGKLDDMGGNVTTLPGMTYRYYLAQLTYVDEQIGSLLNVLDASDAANSTIVVFTADHGYSFGHRNHIGKQLNIAEVTMVPFILRVPWLEGLAGRFADGPASNLDIFPTLVDAAGLPSIPSCPKGQRTNDIELCTEGVSLWSQLASGSGDVWMSDRQHPVMTRKYYSTTKGVPAGAMAEWKQSEYYTCYAEVSMWNIEGPVIYRYNRRSAAACCLTSNCTTKIDFIGPACESLFAFSSDPFELHDVFSTASPELIARLRAEMNASLTH